MFTFIESSLFKRVLPVYLDDDEYSELQQYLIQNPEAGELVPGSGVCAKYAGHGPERESGVDSGSFICSVPTQRVLDADPVCKGKAREHSCAHPKAGVGGV